VLLWVFIACQAMLLISIIAAVDIGHVRQHTPGCYHHHWWPLFDSQASCVAHSGGAPVTVGLSITTVIACWAVADVMLAASYRQPARRPQHSARPIPQDQKVRRHGRAFLR
jgi:hypothetical protein